MKPSGSDCARATLNAAHAQVLAVSQLQLSDESVRESKVLWRRFPARPRITVAVQAINSVFI